MYTFTLHKIDDRNMRLVMRNFACFNGYGCTDSMVKTTGAQWCFNFHKPRSGRMTISREPDYYNDDGFVHGHFMGLGWVCNEFLRFRPIDVRPFLISRCRSGEYDFFKALSENHIFGNNAKYVDSFDMSNIKIDKTRVLSEKEKEISSFFNCGRMPDATDLMVNHGFVEGSSGSNSIGEDGTYCGSSGLYEFIRCLCLGVPNMGFDIVGSDRNAGFSVSYLMSFRNICVCLSSVCFGERSMPGLNSILGRSVFHEILNKSYAFKIDPMFMLGVVNHNGSDSEIFVHAGPIAESFGTVNGFFAMEEYFTKGSLMEVKRYFKGSQSSDLQQRIKTVGEPYGAAYLGVGFGGLLRNPIGMDIYTIVEGFCKSTHQTYNLDNGLISNLLNYISRRVPSLVIKKLETEDSKVKGKLLEDAKLFKEWVCAAETVDVQPMPMSSADRPF